MSLVAKKLVLVNNYPLKKRVNRRFRIVELRQTKVFVVDDRAMESNRLITLTIIDVCHEPS